jgi:hypothetical protein
VIMPAGFDATIGSNERTYKKFVSRSRSSIIHR